MINKVGCLITGYGKTKACRKIADKELVLDSVTITKNRSQVFGSYGLFGGIETPIEIAYCIHMLSPEETTSHQVVETDLLHYMYYAEGNINYFGTLRAFYKSFEDSATKYLLVPYCNTLDEKALALQNYFDNH
ncbi:MAG: hypothetical protein UHN47_07185 [Lachnospiraceae bacterium]|nr:hypothetical protein [Lachnospiraceae bacterium]